MILIVQITLQIHPVEEATLEIEITITVEIEVRVLIGFQIVFLILPREETVVLIVLDHLDPIIRGCVIDPEVLIVKHAITVVDKMTMTIILNRTVETNLLMAVTVGTLASIGLIPTLIRKTKYPCPRSALEQADYSNADSSFYQFDKVQF
jgi:hypothetical protein